MEEFSPASKKWTTALFGLVIAFAAFALLANSLTSPPSVSAYPQAQATPTPTCPPQPPGCPQPRVRGYQPLRPTIAPTFDSAATNSLGSSAPTYDTIYRGSAPTVLGSLYPLASLSPVSFSRLWDGRNRAGDSSMPMAITLPNGIAPLSAEIVATGSCR